MPALPEDETNNVPEITDGIADGPYWNAVLSAEHPETIRAILEQDFLKRAHVFTDDKHPFNPEKPFIVYPPMNRRPEGWVAVACARLYQLECGVEPSQVVTVVGIPRSARWMEEPVRRTAVFVHTQELLVTKDPLEIPAGVSFFQKDVLSYVHNRQADGSRGPEAIFFADPKLWQGRHVLLFEDAIAEGETVLGVASALRNLGVGRIGVAAVLSKGPVQGGAELIRASRLVDELVEGVSVREVLGPGYNQFVLGQ